MENYIVALKEDEQRSESEQAGRRDFYEAGVARTAAFQCKLKEWLHEKHLESEVAGIGEPTVFPLVSLTTTPKMAACIEALPEVDYVLRDNDDLGIVR
jgi:hypothetical protein